MRAIQIRAPILCSIRLLGISNRKYPKKKIPATNPNCLLLMTSSLFIVSAANPMLIRSRKEMMYRRKTKGRILMRTFRIVFAPIEIEVIVGPLPTLTSGRESDKKSP
jgi:hypothetical protein